MQGTKADRLQDLALFALGFSEYVSVASLFDPAWDISGSVLC
jgi:hypothetical protein